MSVQSVIETKLEASFQPLFLQVENESHSHNVPANSETHFKVVIVSDVFESKRAVARHQSVYKILSEELAGGVHALAIHTYTAAEWQVQDVAPESPPCLGGSKADSKV